MRKMPVVQDAAHSPTGAASARPAESPAIAGPPTPANDEPAARAMPPAPAIGKSNTCGRPGYASFNFRKRGDIDHEHPCRDGDLPEVGVFLPKPYTFDRIAATFKELVGAG
jgi:hypothetical protein